MPTKPKPIAIDFDGTVVTHEYPNIGKNIGAIPVLKRLVREGHDLILFTMRSGDKLLDAVQWFKDNDIKLAGVQYNPTQGKWTTSNKCYAALYIDDAALGAPLVYEEAICDRPFIDWNKVELIMEEIGYLTEDSLQPESKQETYQDLEKTELPIQKAVGALVDELRKDRDSLGSLYHGWQSNIATAFYDEAVDMIDRFNIHEETLHKIANNGAKRFLNLLIRP